MKATAREKKIWLVDGGELVDQFYDCGLLDEILTFVASVALGSKAHLLPRTVTTSPLELISVQKLRTALVHLHYKVPHQTV